MSIPKKLSEKGYIFSREFKPGGQSKTTLISKEGELFLLKRPLVEILSKEHSFRFKQEADALSLIDGNGVPKVYNYCFDNEPYILMEYINGQSLNDLVNGNPLSVDEAIDITFKILKILGKVHEIGLLHRDIKPDNIVIKDNDEVFLIDFGLCRIEGVDTDYKTPPSKELGNRFLRLPEFSKGEKVSSSVSDVTFVVGLLFYMLSGKAPNILLDENNKYPQERIMLPDEIINSTWLMRTFDKGFSYQIAQRFQNTEELALFMTEQKKSPAELGTDNPSEQFTMLLSTNEFKRRDDVLSLVYQAHKEFILGVNEILNEHLVTGGSGPNSGNNRLTVVTSFFIQRNGHSQPLSPYNLVSVIDEDLNVITYNCDFEDPKLRTVKFSPSEKERVLSEYKNLGKLRGKEAVRKLIELVKVY